VDGETGHVLARRDRPRSASTRPRDLPGVALRQARERHPLPAVVVRGDLLGGARHRVADLITVVGSAVDEIGAAHRAAAIAVLVDSLAPGGRLILAELADVVAAPTPVHATVQCRRCPPRRARAVTGRDRSRSPRRGQLHRHFLIRCRREHRL
jgi:hypothetical protein